MVEVVVLPSEAAVAVRIATLIATALAEKPEAVVALPAGNSPRPVYAELVRRHREGQGQARLSFARATTFGLDEYVGLSPDHPSSFRHFLDETLYRHVDLPRGRAHAPDAMAPEPVELLAACARYEEAIAAAGGLDLVLLGIGGNGHIAFNEPPSPFDSRTRVVTLTDETRLANAGAFPGGHVPERALTMGIGTILSARRCLLMACGTHKARAIAAALEEPPSPARPASALRDHPHALVVLDQAAAGALAPTTLAPTTSGR
jgi:glucosamine-6-phosphate deaminase